MGQTISKAHGSLITRTIQRFNIEARTDKVLAKEKPTSAPRFKSDEELLESIRQDRPDLGKYLNFFFQNLTVASRLSFQPRLPRKKTPNF